MFFLLRSAFWIALVLLLLPIDTGGDDESGTAGINPVRAFFAAQSTISDLSGFCERNPQTCETGGDAIAQISAKAKVSAKIIYDYLDEEAGLTTGGTGTLLPGDLEPDFALALPVADMPADADAAQAATGSAPPATAPATLAAPSTGDNVSVPLPRPRGKDRPA